MLIGIPVYNDVDTLDVAGMFEMFRWAGFEVELAAQAARSVRSRNRFCVAAKTVFDDAGNALPGIGALSGNAQPQPSSTHCRATTPARSCGTPCWRSKADLADTVNGRGTSLPEPWG